MSPHEGEHALSLLFGVVPAVLGGLIAIYIVVRVIQDQMEKKRVNAQRPDPQVFKDYPELQAMIDQLYLTRYKIKHEAQARQMSAKELDQLMRQIDALIERGMEHAEALRVATEDVDIMREREAMAAIQKEISACGS